MTIVYIILTVALLLVARETFITIENDDDLSFVNVTCIEIVAYLLTVALWVIAISNWLAC